MSSAPPSHRVLAFGTYESDYSRNRVLLAAMGQAGMEVVTAHVPLTERVTNKTGAALSPLAALGWTMRLLVALPVMVVRFFLAGRHDSIWVLYPGAWDMPLAWLLERCRYPLNPRPIIYSPLVSLHDTLVADRGEWAAGSLRARLALALDRLACRLATRVVLDTQAHAEFFAESLGVPREKLSAIPVGAEEELFPFTPYPEPNSNAPFRVLFYGKVSPLHGDDVIAEAVARLGGDARFHFHLIGTGQRSAEMKARLAALPNVTWEDWVPYERLGACIARADIVLGVFGTGEKSRRVIANKIYQAASVGRAIVTGETETLREIFRPGSLIEIPRGDPAALVAALERLCAHRSHLPALGAAAHADFRGKAATGVLARLVILG